jgi:hypothetical protein
MLLSARILNDVGGVNTFSYAQVAEFTEGDAPTIYFQLIDESLDRDSRPAGRRYMPAAGATLQVVIHNIDDAKTATRFATQPFAQDPSIWSISLLTTDTVRGTCSVKLTLTEGAKVTRGTASNVISADSQTVGR